MKNVKQRKMILVLPLLVIPFLTMAFWALGGGSGSKKSFESAKGLNLDLPDANLKDDKLLDKLGFYDKADKDSLKMEEWMRSDPYFKRDTVPVEMYPNELQDLTTTTASKFNQRLNTSPYEKGGNNPEDQIMQKLKLLENEMNRNTASTYDDPVKQRNADNEFSSEVDRLEQLLKVNNTSSNDDPEIKQLEGTLDKILDIQHPQRVKERSIKNKDAVYAVRRTSGADTIVKGFYSYSEDKEYEEQNAVEAVVYGNQVLVNGSVVKFRLLNDIYVKGQLIKAGTYINGIASLNNERLEIEINSVRYGKSLYSVKMEVYDIDGLPGIYIPGAITRDAAKQAADNSLSLMDMATVDPSLKGQATATGIGAIKNLLSKKTKLVKVTVKSGYKVLLKDKNQD